MTALDYFKRLLLKVNLNDTNGNVTIPKSTAVIIYNQEKDPWLKKRIEEGLASDDLDDVAEFLVSDEELIKIQDYKDSTDFELPEDFLEFSRSYSLATKGSCKDRPLYNWNIKNKNINTILQNENDKPSFEYEETLIKITGNKLKVYKTDFKVTKQFLDYYKRPKAIDIAGYIKFDGSPSTNINPDFSDYLVDEIISKVALEIMRNQTNQTGFQFAKERVTEQIK